MPRGRLLFAALLPLLISAASAAPVPADATEPVATGSPRTTPPQAPQSPQPPQTPPGQPAPGAPGAQPAPGQPGLPGQPGAVVPRRPRPFEQCRQIAFQRHLRGAERRHYLTRCQLGYGRPLFRRRGRGPGAAPAPAPVPAPQGHHPAPT